MLERADGVRAPYRKYQYARNTARLVIQEADSLARTFLRSTVVCVHVAGTYMWNTYV